MPAAEEVSVIIPAHNESVSLPRLLAALVADGLPEDVDVVVVCNGCTDNTAELARSYDAVRVFEIDEASKRAALSEGDRRAAYTTRAYVDADVLLTQADLGGLVAAVRDQGLLAAAPERMLDRRGVPRVVSWYYDVWERLPQVRSGLFGRGVIVLSGAGHDRVSSLPKMMSDDLLMSEAFAATERGVVPGTAVSIRLPRTTADLIRRRTRVSTGNAEMDAHGLRTGAAKTSLGTLVRMLGGSPWLLPKVSVFVAVTLAARVKARRHIQAADFDTWHRDESSRAE